MGRNILRFLGAIALFAVVCGGATWLLFGSAVAIRYLYLAIGVGLAVASVFETIRRLNQNDGTISSQMINVFVRSKAFSSPATVLRLIVLVVREAALRLTYWPLELGLMSIEDKLARSPNALTRGAATREFAPDIPALTATWMLCINLAFLSIYYFFGLENGSSLDVIVTISMYVTIIWFVDFFLNPIEIQLRQAGTVRQAASRFALVCVLSLAAITTLVYTYRLFRNSDVSFIGVLGDVLFAGRFNAEYKQAEAAIFERIADRDFAAAWNTVLEVDQGLLVSVLACLLFYLTIGKRLLPIITGGSSAFQRTEAESVAAAASSLQCGAFDDARKYVVEIPVDHPLVSLIDIREAFAQRKFDEAFNNIELFVNSSRRKNRLKDVVLDPREKWMALVMFANAGPDGSLDLEFAVWSIEQPFLKEHDLAKFIATRFLFGGTPQVVALAHYLSTRLDHGGDRATHFRSKVVSRFLLGAWNKRPSRVINGNTFDEDYLEYLSGAIQTDKALLLLKGAPIYAKMPEDVDRATFGDYINYDTSEGWVDAAAFETLQGLDRLYVVDTMASMAGVLGRSENDEQRNLAVQITATRERLEKHWGSPIFERYGSGKDFASELGMVVGTALN